MNKLKNIAISTLIIASSSSAIAGTYEISDAQIKQLFSGTFDGLVNLTTVHNGGPAEIPDPNEITQDIPNPDYTFFGSIGGPISTGAGTGIPVEDIDISNLVWPNDRTVKIELANSNDTATGQLSFDGSLMSGGHIEFPEINMTINDTNLPPPIGAGRTFLAVNAVGARLTFAGPQIDMGAVAGKFDVGGSLDANTSIVAGAFSKFDGGVVTSCVGVSGNCGLLAGLNLHPTRYTIEGTPAAGAVLTLFAQTSNKSFYEVEITLGDEVGTGGKNVPAMGAFGLIALFIGLIGVARKLSLNK
jgi:hypothetical protein